MRIEQKATIISMCVAFSLAVMKLFIGIFTGSIAILSNAIDSLLDMGVSLFNTIAVHNANKKPDTQFNYGRGKIEALAAFLEGIIISASAVYIFYESINKLIKKEAITDFGWGFGVMIISVIATTGLVLFLNSVARKTKNLVIESDALHYKTDLLSNSAILIGLAVMYFTSWNWVDAVLGIAIAFYIAYSAYEIIKKWFLLLMDASLEAEEVEKIKTIIQDHSEIRDFHEFRTRHSGITKFVEAHLVFDRDISLLAAHDISHEIEDEIRHVDTTSNWSILFHLDPYDDAKRDQKNKIHSA